MTRKTRKTQAPAREDAASIFERMISRQEELRRKNACQRSDETDAEFAARLARALKMIVVPVGHASIIPGIEAICPEKQGCPTRFGNYFVSRRKVDQLDNVYVWRA